MVIIQTPNWLAVLLSLVILFWVLRGHVAILTGVFAAMASWTMIVRLGPVSHIWILLAAVLASALVYWWKSGRSFRLPKIDTWIIPVMIGWWLWYALILVSFYEGSAGWYEQFISLVCYNVTPLLMLLLFADKTGDLRRFAMAYAITMSIGGLVGLSLLSERGISWDIILRDPLLSNYGSGIQQWFIHAIGVANYHAFAYGFAVTLLFVIAFAQQSRNWFGFLFYSSWIVYSIYFLFVSNSRQAIASAFFSILILGIWFLTHSVWTKRIQLSLIIGALVITTLSIIAIRPELLLRTSSSITQALNLGTERGYYWQLGFELFARSPLWGVGLARGSGIGHNLFINTLSGQGVIGLFFFLLFLFFWTKQALIVTMSSRGDKGQKMWAIVFMVLGLFNLVASQASGSPVSAWFLFWSAAVIWKLRYAMLRTAATAPYLKDFKPQTKAITRRLPFSTASDIKL